MKLRTSSYNRTLLRKNITRFFPFWGLYVLCLLLGLMILSGGDKEFYVVMNLAECARIMALINCGYAMLVAQLLFGDLYDSRMCSGLHALPMRREEIFGVNILSGLLFSLVPSLIMALVSLPLMLNSQVVNAWQISFLWLLADNLEFVFFFGLAVLCVFFAANRFSMVVMYGILNFWAILVRFMLESLYLPMLAGVGASFHWVQLLCPMVHIMDNPLMIVSRENPGEPGLFRLEPTWGYLWLCAGIGVVLMLAALLLYRRRKLETAGEFIAVKSLRPVFLVAFALCCASGFDVASQIFFGYSETPAYGIFFSAVGLVTGWFAAMMLVEKTAHVFFKKSWLRMGILLAVLLASFLLTWLDPLNTKGWLPDGENVESVRLGDSYNYYYGKENRKASDRITDRGDIDLAIRLHEIARDRQISDQEMNALWTAYYRATEEDDRKQTDGMEDPNDRYITVSFEYTMKNGSVRRRHFHFPVDEESREIAGHLYSLPQVLFRNPDILRSRAAATELRVDQIYAAQKDLTWENTQALLKAMEQDCLEGRAARFPALHRTPIYDDGEHRIDNLNLYLGLSGDLEGFAFPVYSSCIHTISWLEELGYLDQAIDQRLEEIIRWEHN